MKTEDTIPISGPTQTFLTATPMWRTYKIKSILQDSSKRPPFQPYGDRFQQKGNQFQPKESYDQRAPYPPKEPYGPPSNQPPLAQRNNNFEGMFQQIMDGQKRNNKEMNEKMDTLFNDLHAKYDAVAAHVKKLEVQVAQTEEAVKRQEMESRKSFCNSSTIEKKFEDSTLKWKLSPPKYDCMTCLEPTYPEKESNQARRRRLFPKSFQRRTTPGCS